MMSIFNPTLAPLTLLTHPFQVALMVVTFGALVRDGVRAWSVCQAHVIDRAIITDSTNVRAAA